MTAVFSAHSVNTHAGDPAHATTAWVVVASEDHVQLAVHGGFIQAGHGKHSAVARFAAGDTVICYSPKCFFERKDLCQSFTALGEIADVVPAQVRVNDQFAPFRRAVKWRPVRSARIKPLIPQLSFIVNKQSWGYKFRFGVFPIPDKDAQRIAAAMNVATMSVATMS